MTKKLIGKWKKGDVILEVFTKDGVLHARVSEVIDENTQETSPSEKLDEGVSLEDVLRDHGMGDEDKVC